MKNPIQYILFGTALILSGCASQNKTVDMNAPLNEQISFLKSRLENSNLDDPLNKKDTALNYAMLRTKLAQNGQCREAIQSYSYFIENTIDKQRYFSTMEMTPGNFLINCMNNNPDIVPEKLVYYAYGYSEVFNCAYKTSFNNARINVFPKYSSEEKITAAIAATNPDQKNTKEQVQEFKKLLTEDCGFIESLYKPENDYNLGVFNYQKSLANRYMKMGTEAQRRGITLFLPIIMSLQLGHEQEMEFAARSIQLTTQVQQELTESRQLTDILYSAQAIINLGNNSTSNTLSPENKALESQTYGNNKNILNMAYAVASGDKKAIQSAIAYGYVNYVLEDSNTPFSEGVRQLMNTYNTEQLGSSITKKARNHMTSGLSPQCQQMVKNINLPTLATNDGPAACPAFRAQAQIYTQIADIASRCATPAEAADARRVANEATQAAQQFCGDTYSHSARQPYTPPSRPRPTQPAAPEVKTECASDLIGSKCPRRY